MDNKLSKSIYTGFLWQFLERILTQLIAFIVSLIIARILTPDDYGLVAMCFIFINIANVFVVNGFNAALIQKKDADETDFSTLFYCSLSTSILLYLIIYFAAPIIANWYEQESLEMLIRVFGLILPLSSYNSIQNAYLSKQMNFKKLFISSLAGTLISAITGIILAIQGYGVWALVAQFLTNTIIDSCVLSFSIKWRPKALFSIKKAKPLFSFGVKVLLSDLIGTIYNQLNAFLVGKKYTTADLAFYTKGQQFPDLISSNIGNSLTTVLFPAFALKSDNHNQIKEMCSKVISVSSFILHPLYFGLIAISHNLIIILLTDKWLQCKPFMIIMCIHGIIGAFDIIDIQVLKALGKSNIVLKMEMYKKPLYLIITLIALQFDLITLALVVPICGIIAVVINSHFVSKFIDYNLLQKIKDSGKSIIAAAIMCIGVYFMNYINLNLLILLTLQIAVGITIYFLLSIIINKKVMDYSKNLIKKRLTNENNSRK